MTEQKSGDHGMFSQPEHHHNLSQRLSQVLDDIGVNNTMILKRRRAMILSETLSNTFNQYMMTEIFGSKGLQLREFREHLISSHYFGSQIEGSTTQGLHSDTDHLGCFQFVRIIQDWSEWKHLPDKTQYMMVQDETTSPGYCLLQLTRDDAPLPAQEILHDDEHYTIDNRGRVLLRHSIVFHILALTGFIRHGPAIVARQVYDMDMVFAFPCLSWPKEADPWLHKQNLSGWPTEEMKKYSAEQGCFVVPISSMTGVNQDLEWRISTSMAERCLMFNINITQMSCYILMKMILKTFLKPKCREAISSFMCKNILFHCIAESENCSTWNESSLLTCLSKCLQSLLNCIRTDHCAHFIIPGNNLLAGKLSADVKHQLLKVMSSLNENIWDSLLSIQIDDLGHRLHVKSGGISHVHLKTPYDISFQAAISNYICVDLLIQKIQAHLARNFASGYQILIDNVKHSQTNNVVNTAEQVALSLYAPFLCSQIGSVIASKDIQRAKAVSPQALIWFTVGLNSDISSGKLMLASALYCAGTALYCAGTALYCAQTLKTCEIILDALRMRLSLTPFGPVGFTCTCTRNRVGFPKNRVHVYEPKCSADVARTYLTLDFVKACCEKNVEDLIKHNITFRVFHLPDQVNCVPNELKFEMFRTTAEERPYRDRSNFWMDWAVVDSISYLYFLQYKVYTQLHRPAEQRQALDNLIRTIDTDPMLDHRETALNLLGQCMEQENRVNAALCCYMMSLKVRERNNAAKWHVCRLLARMCKSRSE